MKTLLLILGSLAVVACCAVLIWCAVDMRRNVEVMRAMNREMSEQLQLHRDANERARAVMASLRGRSIEYRELRRWFDAWGMLDGMATLALEYHEDPVVLAQFREQFELTLEAARAARKASDNGAMDHRHDRQPERPKGDRGGA